MTKRLCVPLWRCVCVFGTDIILHSITSSHHLHNITSYIILHQWHKKGIQWWPSENASKRWNCAKAQNKFWRDTALSALKWRKKSIVDEASVLWRRLKHYLWSTLISRKKVYYWRSINVSATIGGFFTKHKNSSLRSMKRREGVFSLKAQNGMYIKVSCIAKKWITKPFIHYIKNSWAPNITSIIQQMLH